MLDKGMSDTYLLYSVKYMGYSEITKYSNIL